MSDITSNQNHKQKECRKKERISNSNSYEEVKNFTVPEPSIWFSLHQVEL
jgi:hypothetical protein